MSYLSKSFDSKIVELLRGGGIGLLPSDTIYGLSARALDREAVERLHGLKDRSAHKPFIILISDSKMLDLLGIAAADAQSLDQCWPGALSVVFEAPRAPEWLQRGTQTLAVRLPDYPELTSLISKTGPLISTSANIEGGEPVKSVAQAQELFGDNLDFYVDVGELTGEPSTLVSLAEGQLQVIRQGAVKIKA